MNAAALLLAVLPAAAPVNPAVASIAYTGDGKLLFVGVRDDRPRGAEPDAGRLYVWDLSKPELKAVVEGLPSDLRAVRPTPDGKRFVLIAGDDWHVRTIEVWDAGAKKRLHAFETSPRGGQAVASPDGKWVAFLPHRDEFGRRADVKPTPKAKVWDTETGKPMAEVENALATVAGSPAATPDGKHLIVASAGEYAEYDVATGKKAAGWKRDKDIEGDFMESRFAARVAPVPGVKGVVTVAATGKRRQSYVVRLATEKKDWFLAEFWDQASAPVVAPDGRTILVSAASRGVGTTTYALKLDANGEPELTDKPEFGRPARGEAKGPAWREWRLGEENRAGVTAPPSALAFSPDGKRVLAGGRGGQLRVFDTEKRELQATLAVFAGEKDAEWLVTTPGGGYVGSPAQEKEQAKTAKDRDPAAVKQALGVK